MQSPSVYDMEILRDKLSYHELEMRLHALESKLKFHETAHKDPCCWEAFYDQKGQIFYLSPAFEILTGISKTELLDGSVGLKDLMTADDLVYINYFLHHLEKGLPSPEFECRIKNKQAVFKSFRVFSQLIEGAKGEVLGVKCVFTDISDIRAAQNAAAEIAEKLKEHNKTKDKLFSIIAHDLRSPFSSILGYAELLHGNIDEFDIEQVREFLGFIKSSTKNTLNLLDNLLSWSKSQSGKIIFSPQKIVLIPVVKETADMLSDAARIKSISIHHQFNADDAVWADLNMFKVVMRNLLANAIKFTDIGGEIEINAKTLQNQMEITVSDNGVGIGAEVIDKLFQVDFKTTTFGTANEKGSGLGLILCKEFVERHKGRIWVESNLGVGSDFKFTLPLWPK